MSLRGAVLAVCLLIGLTAGFTVLRGGGTDAEVGSVELAAGEVNSTPRPESGTDAGNENGPDPTPTSDVTGSAGEPVPGTGRTEQTAVPSVLDGSAGGTANANQASLLGVNPYLYLGEHHLMGWEIDGRNRMRIVDSYAHPALGQRKL